MHIEDKLIECDCIGDGFIVLLETQPIYTETLELYTPISVFSIAAITAFASLPIILICYCFYYLMMKQISMPNMEGKWKLIFIIICLLILFNICCIITFYIYYILIKVYSSLLVFIIDLA